MLHAQLACWKHELAAAVLSGHSCPDDSRLSVAMDPVRDQSQNADRWGCLADGPKGVAVLVLGQAFLGEYGYSHEHWDGQRLDRASVRERQYRSCFPMSLEAVAVLLSWVSAHAGSCRQRAFPPSPSNQVAPAFDCQNPETHCRKAAFVATSSPPAVYPFPSLSTRPWTTCLTRERAHDWPLVVAHSHNRSLAAHSRYLGGRTDPTLLVHWCRVASIQHWVGALDAHVAANVVVVLSAGIARHSACPGHILREEHTAGRSAAHDTGMRFVPVRSDCHILVLRPAHNSPRGLHIVGAELAHVQVDRTVRSGQRVCSQSLRNRCNSAGRAQVPARVSGMLAAVARRWSVGRMPCCCAGVQLAMPGTTNSAS